MKWLSASKYNSGVLNLDSLAPESVLLNTTPGWEKQQGQNGLVPFLLSHLDLSPLTTSALLNTRGKLKLECKNENDAQCSCYSGDKGSHV